MLKSSPRKKNYLWAPWLYRHLFPCLRRKDKQNHLILGNVLKVTYFFSQIIGVRNALGSVSF